MAFQRLVAKDINFADIILDIIQSIYNLFNDTF
jgi:hypothetical protein